MANIYLALKRDSLEIETLSASLKRKITVILEERNVLFILLFTGVSSREITSGDEASGSVLLPAPIQGDLLPATAPLRSSLTTVLEACLVPLGRQKCVQRLLPSIPLTAVGTAEGRARDSARLHKVRCNYLCLLFCMLKKIHMHIYGLGSVMVKNLFLARKGRQRSNHKSFRLSRKDKMKIAPS